MAPGGRVPLALRAARHNVSSLSNRRPFPTRSPATSFVVWVCLFLAGTAGVALAQSSYVSPSFQVDVFAGYAGRGSADGTGQAATFNLPNGVAVDGAGNAYVTDSDNSIIRKITPAGVVTTMAGSAGVEGVVDGPGAAARFNRPFGLAASSAGTLYVADTGSHIIRKITSAGVVTTLAGAAANAGSADGTGISATFNNPTALALNPATGDLYVSDTSNNIVRKITSAGVVTTVAGTAVTTGAHVDGIGAAARFNSPIALALNAAGTVLYVADSGSHVIRAITLATASVSTLAGLADTAGSTDATGAAARFDQPKGLALHAASGDLFVADANGGRIRRVTTGGVVTTVAGQYLVTGSANGTGAAATFAIPTGLAVDAGTGRLLIADSLNSQLRSLDVATGAVSALAGKDPLRQTAADGAGDAARFNAPRDLARDASGNLYVADRDNHVIRKITAAGLVSTLAGAAGQSGSTDDTGAAARFNKPAGIAVKADGSLIYVAESGNHLIRQITAGGVVTTLAGAAGAAGIADGTGAAARFNQPSAIALKSTGELFVSDFGNQTLRKITAAGAVTTFAGLAGANGSANALSGPATAARFSGPLGLAFDAADNLYVADSVNQTIRKITTAGVVSTFAGAAGVAGSKDAIGAAARFNYPYDVEVEISAPGRIYVVEYGQNTVRRISPDGTVYTLAGTPDPLGGVENGLADDARFLHPQAIALDGAGGFYMADTGNNTIRHGTLATMTSAANPGGVVGQAFSYAFTGSTVLRTFTASGLPGGLSIGPGTGIISGTPSVSAASVVTVRGFSWTTFGLLEATVTVSIAKATATVTLGGLTAAYDGTPRSATATTLPSGRTVTFTYNGSATPPTSVGTYVVVATIADANYQGTATDTFTITAPVTWSVAAYAGAAGQAISGIAVGTDGTLYLADAAKNVIRKRTAGGVETVLAGGGGVGAAGYVDATGTAARFNAPSSLAVDASGDVYVADSGNNCIRKITAGGVVSLVAGSGDPFDVFNSNDGVGAGAGFYMPSGIAFAPDGSLLVADFGNGAIRRITLPGGAVTTLIPSGTIQQPTGLVVAADGTFYVSDQSYHQVWRVTTYNTATLLAGNAIGVPGFADGVGTAASFNFPRGLALAANGNLYVADAGNHALRQITPDGTVSTVAGLGGTSGPASANGFGTTARFNEPSALAFAAEGSLYVADMGNLAMRLASPPPVVPVISSPASATATEGLVFGGYAITATGSPTSYAATGLPAGLTINAATGQITGTPLSSGVYPATLSATNVLTTVNAGVTFTVVAPAWDTWRAAHFNSGELADTAISGPGADPDGDGVANLLEYIQGRDPRTRDASPPTFEVSGGYIVFTYESLRALVGWQLSVETSTDLVTWNTGDGYTELLDTTVLDVRRQRVRVRASQSLATQPRLFVRLRVSSSP